jgi:phage gpG-like protein
MLSVEIIGAEGLKQDLNSYSKESQIAIDKAVSDTAQMIRTVAMNRLKGMLGSDPHSKPKIGKSGKQQGHGGAGLLDSIKRRKIQLMEWVTGTNQSYAAFIEFGTGDLVFTNFEFDDEAKKVAADFKGKGIRKVNIKGDSFLNYAAVDQSKKLLERIETELNKINK